jgi:hypothetical protein
MKSTRIACILLGKTNKMQLFTVFFITVNAVHVSGGFSAHHQELKNCTHSIWYVPGLLAATASVVGLELRHDESNSPFSQFCNSTQKPFTLFLVIFTGVRLNKNEVVLTVFNY